MLKTWFREEIPRGIMENNELAVSSGEWHGKVPRRLLWSLGWPRSKNEVDCTEPFGDVRHTARFEFEHAEPPKIQKTAR